MKTGHKGLHDYNANPKEHIGEENSYLYIFSQMILISPYHYEKNIVLYQFKKNILTVSGLDVLLVILHVF